MCLCMDSLWSGIIQHAWEHLTGGSGDTMREVYPLAWGVSSSLVLLVGQCA
jgi:hypothetical protein